VNIEFNEPENVVGQYQNLKTEEDADLFIALTHLGLYNYRDDILGDDQLAHQFPYFDLIIGGHTNELLDTVINDIPVLIANKYLNYLGRTRLKLKDKAIISMQTDHIDLNSIINFDADMQEKIDGYHSAMSYLQDVIGNSEINLDRYQTGCFYVDALREYMNVDLTFQNPGGVRAGLDQGSISIADIYSIEPFNNGTVIYEMTVLEIEDFLTESGSGFYYSGLILENSDGELFIRDTEGNLLEDNDVLSVGINDYIPAVYGNLFPESGETQELTAAETLTHYLLESSAEVYYPVCDCYFYYQFK
jgi:5'-nucleotidase/UDP-sugar diphosphatase